MSSAATNSEKSSAKAGKKKEGKKEKQDKALAKEAKKKKQESKALRTQKKKSSKAKKNAAAGDSDNDDGEDMDDAEFDKLVSEIIKKNDAQHAVSVEKLACEPKELRASFSITLAGLNQPADGFLIFGGEYFDGLTSKCFNDTLRCRILATTPEWKRISSLNSPPPRCAHCACSTPTHVYIFGGEFSTAWKFHHYNDLWRFDLKTNAWCNMPSVNGPSPRSGARMIVWKHYLIVFGGFYEASRGVRWYDDLYLYDLKCEKWMRVKQYANGLAAASCPSPRSGFQFCLHPTKPIAYLFGGYAKIATGATNQRARALDDMWALHLMAGKQGSGGGFPECRWEYISKRGKTFPPKQSGASSVVHRNRILLFGGVKDQETENDVIGEFSNSLFAFDLDRLRWFALSLKTSSNGGGHGDSKKSRRKKNGNKGENATPAEGEESNEEVDDNDDDDDEEIGEDGAGLKDDAFYVLVNGKFVMIENEDDEEEEEKKKSVPAAATAAVSELNPTTPIVVETPMATATASVVVGETIQQVAWNGQPAPAPRISAGVVVCNHKLYVYGGTCERGNVQITFDDLWSLDLNKMDAWVEVLAGTWKAQQWKEKEESEDDEDDDDDSSSNSSGGEEEEGDGGDNDVDDDEEDVTRQNVRELSLEVQALKSELEVDDPNSTPQPTECLQAFFKRTSEHWVRECAINWEDEKLSGKELRGRAFTMCKRRFDLLSPLLEKLNALQEAQRLAKEEFALESQAVTERLARRQAKKQLLKKE